MYKVCGWVELVLLPFCVITDLSWMAEEVFSIPNLNILTEGEAVVFVRVIALREGSVGDAGFVPV